ARALRKLAQARGGGQSFRRGPDQRQLQLRLVPGVAPAMKNLPFRERFGFAWRGIRMAWRSETSFRTQVVMGAGAIAVLLTLKPQPLWWALFFVIIAAVLAAELINTALEHVVDRLHPETHPLIALAKDCAAGAVLVLSFAALAVLGALLWERRALI